MTQKIEYGTNGKDTMILSAGTGEEGTSAKDGGSVFQKADVSGKRIFDNLFLCAQFLRDYSGLDILKNVRPEDLEKVNLRYHLFDEAELNSDSAVRVRLSDGASGEFTGDEAGNPPLYIVPLIDHKSQVDYNVAMQLFYYMACIWKDWEKEMQQKYGLDCRKKGFRYPLIFPIVYYEGDGRWSSECHLADRISMSDALPEYVPDFKYHVVQIRDYSNQELMEKGDEISLLMLLNKLQHAEDFENLQNLVSSGVDKIMTDSPANVIEIIAGTVYSLCRRMNVPDKETDEYIGKIRKERRMGYLFENMEKMDIQLERRLRKEAEEKAEAAEKAAKETVEAAQKAAKEAAKEASKTTGLRTTIEVLQDISYSYEETKKKLMEKYSIDEEEADRQMQLYWK